MSEKSEKRRSERSTSGVPPDRYTDPDLCAAANQSLNKTPQKSSFQEANPGTAQTTPATPPPVGGRRIGTQSSDVIGDEETLVGSNSSHPGNSTHHSNTSVSNSQ